VAEGTYEGDNANSKQQGVCRPEVAAKGLPRDTSVARGGRRAAIAMRQPMCRKNSSATRLARPHTDGLKFVEAMSKARAAEGREPSYPAGQGWSFRVKNQATDKYTVSRRVLASMDTAKLRAFDTLIRMKERGE
jgi:hypothetical protein